jgi:hypothetical protein
MKWTPKIKSLLPPPLQKGGIPLFEKEGLGEILGSYVWLILDSLGNK